MAASPNYFANDTITPSRIVVGDVTKDFHVKQAASSTSIPFVGISQDGTRDAPGVTGSGTYAAKPGDPIRVHGVGEEALLEVKGSTTIDAGNLITAHTDGTGRPVVSSDTLTYTVGWANERGTGGQLIRVTVSPSQIGLVAPQTVV